MTQTMIDRMVERFLSWPLPKDFAPDCGITFERGSSAPVGTNLFTAPQARAMVAHMLDGAVREERERIARFIESREYAADGEGRGSKELADAVRGME